MNYKILWLKKAHTKKFPANERTNDLIYWPEEQWNNGTDWLVLMNPTQKDKAYFTCTIHISHRLCSSACFKYNRDGYDGLPAQTIGRCGLGGIYEHYTDFSTYFPVNTFPDDIANRLMMEASQLFIGAKQLFNSNYSTYEEYRPIKEAKDEERRQQQEARRQEQEARRQEDIARLHARLQGRMAEPRGIVAKANIGEIIVRAHPFPDPFGIG